MNFNSLVWYSSLAIGDEKNSYVANFLKRSCEIINEEINKEIKEKNLPFTFNIDFSHVVKGEEGVQSLLEKFKSINDIVFTNGHSINKYNPSIINELKEEAAREKQRKDKLEEERIERNRAAVLRESKYIGWTNGYDQGRWRSIHSEEYQSRYKKKKYEYY